MGKFLRRWYAIAFFFGILFVDLSTIKSGIVRLGVGIGLAIALLIVAVGVRWLMLRLRLRYRSLAIPTSIASQDQTFADRNW